MAKPTDPRIVAAALETLVTEGLPAAAKFAGVSKSTVVRWARKAGITAEQYAQRTDAKNTAEATRVRRETMLRERGELSDMLRNRLGLPAARVIAQRLERVESDEELIELARGRWKDAMAVETQAADFGPDAQLQARQATARAKVDVLVAEAGTISTRDLVGILTRAVHDHLALEGDAATEAQPGEVAVVFTAPRPARGPITVVQLNPDPEGIPA